MGNTPHSKTAIVCGADGFIGQHLVKKLKQENYYVIGVDLHKDLYATNVADEFVVGDLRDPYLCESLFDKKVEEVYQLAADMGGAGFIFTGENDADIMQNEPLININILKILKKNKPDAIFYSSSACVYPEYNQKDRLHPETSEASVYPANPDSDYGWEKLFSERLFLAHQRCYGFNVKIARLHNIFGPEGSWNNGREKSPAAICRKIAEADSNGEIEIWGDGEQTRSYLYIDECLEGIRRLMQSNWAGPVNIGSKEMVTINDLAKRIMLIAKKELKIKHIDGPLGVRGRNSDNRLIAERLGWQPSKPLNEGLAITYQWIDAQVKKQSLKEAV